MVVLVGVGVAVARLADGDAPAGESAAGNGLAPPETSVAAIPKQAPPDVPATARFDFHRKRVSTADAFYVLGEVENTSPFPISKPELVIIMVDEAGKEVGTDSGFALAEILEPGEKSYLSAVVTSPPEHQDLKFEMAPRKATYRPKLAQGLTINALEPQQTHAGMYRFSGSVKNGGETTAKFVNVRVLAFDAEDKLMGVYSTYAKTDGLAPGQRARFQATGVGLEPAPVRFEYQVSARVAD